MMLLLLILVVIGGGWLLGIIGFLQVGAIRAELAVLREAIGRQQSSEKALAAPAVLTKILAVPPVAVLSPAPPVRPARPPRAVDIEALLTMRWGVWLGAAALLFAGVFLIRYAADQGLLGPGMRCVFASVLGIALLVTAELLQRRTIVLPAGPFRADQSPPGLAAGGVAVLLGAAYGAGPYYGLLPPSMGFAAMAVASAVGLGASLRFGQLTAAIGVAGAFVTPALVATQSPSVPGLFAYLFAVSAAALYVVRRTAWIWLGWASIAAGAAWVCIAALGPSADDWAAGAFVPASALLALMILPAEALGTIGGRRLFWWSFALLAAAGLVLESLQGSLFLRIAVLLLSPVAVWKGRAEPRLDRLPWLAAGAGILVLLFWALPVWTQSAEFSGFAGFIEALLPGTWAPRVIGPLLISASVFAAFNVAAGLGLERTAASPIRWSALAAATPVIILAVAYAQIERFQTDGGWAIAAVGLAALLVAAAARARRRLSGRAALQCAGIHAAGAIAALALGCAMLLHDEWLTLAVAMFLPALPWIEARADLPALRMSALAVAGLVLVRLLLNVDVLFYDFGATPVLNGLVAAYAVPALAFGVAAVQFRRRGDDTLVAVLEAGAVALGVCFMALEIRQLFGHGNIEAPARFAELALQLASVSAEATALLYLTRRAPRPVLYVGAMIVGAFAVLLGITLILFNPALMNASAGLAALACGYLVPAGFALIACRWIVEQRRRNALMLYAIVSGFTWITLQIRAGFHPGAIGFDEAPLLDAELWAWSGAWLLYSSALMVYGIWRADRTLRTIALVGIALVCAKVFLIDMAQLTGLWRVLSFLGLGLVLIGLGSVHRRLVLGGPAKTSE
jgi:uncharacterized membrane protein